MNGLSNPSMNYEELLEEIFGDFSQLDPNSQASISIILSFLAIILVVCGTIALLSWILQAIPTYKLAKKAGYKNAFIAWIPIFGNYFRIYALSAIAQDKPFELGKLKIGNRSTSVWIYTAIGLFGTTVISSLVAILGSIPVIGQIISLFATFLLFVPSIVMAIMEYVYIKDVADTFKQDKNSNRTASILVTVLDHVATVGFARAIYLFTLLKYDVIVPEVIQAEPTEPEKIDAE